MVERENDGINHSTIYARMFGKIFKRFEFVFIYSVSISLNLFRGVFLV